MIFSCIVFLPNNVHAQFESKANWFVDGGALFSDPRGLGLNTSFNYFTKKDWLVSLEGTYLGFKVDYVPSNYSPPGISLEGDPEHEFLSLGLLTGKKYSNKKGNAMFVPKIGITFNQYSEVVYESYEGGWVFSSTYQKATYPEKQRSLGLSIGTDLLLTHSDLGIKLSLVGNINRNRSYLAIGTAFMIGDLN